ncbi:UxaA family hydrolase [Picrophilus oshimae]|uniref:Altronate hydrolase n=1 Tax=Picrophilus torridus (strain ATCC 700027 / DSM 9790 / JCM 10055 / NBRC 100828 / KAW 2/3) TaxID=1122961 RepID=Q6L322_PICTO|nr:UxaA family hydrolase [Picrophilus oshimae]AAT42629.1 altronate hydrolase [Picrophilus oshimae DSM 9789]
MNNIKIALVIDEKDNVATLLEGSKAGEKVQLKGLTCEKSIICNQDIPSGHKIAIKNIKLGESVIKYGEIIGRATKEIKIGDYVHIHNIDSIRGKMEVQ